MIRLTFVTKSLLLCSLLIAVLILSCDRFDNTFRPTEPEEPNGNGNYEALNEHLEGFTGILKTALLTNDLTQVMDYYSDDYLYDGRVKSDVEGFYTDLAAIVTADLSIFHALPDSGDFSLTFDLVIRDTGAAIDTTFTEYCLDMDQGFLFIGNQQDIIETEERRVLVELFTATWCPNCPYVETALQDLKLLYGDRFYYLEYHIMDQLDFGNSDILNYYQLPTSLPISIIQGSIRITGGSAADSYDQYHFAVSQFFDQEAQYHFSEFSYDITDDLIEFNVSIISSDPSLENLKLRYALIEKETNVNNAAGQPCRNVVITKGILDLTEENINSVVNSQFALPDFSFSTPKLLLWVQTMEEPYDSETCLIHNVIEYELELP